MRDSEAPFEQTRRDDVLVVSAIGHWVVDQAQHLDRALHDLDTSGANAVRFDLGRLERLDTVGAWLLTTIQAHMEDAGTRTEVSRVRDEHQVLIDHARRHAEAAEEAARTRPAPQLGLGPAVAEVGRRLVKTVDEFLDLVAFIGIVLNRAWRLVLRRQRFEGTSLLAQMQQVWIDAMPIIGVLSFVIGVVLMYQGAVQLERVNQSALSVKLVGISIVRELGVLIAAILVAGRSSSAFAAQIGAMKVRQEVNAMQAMGIDPVAVLVVPRILALLLTLPLLGFFAELVALVGAGMMALFEPGMPPLLFITRLHDGLEPATFWLGIIKAPVFAALIALAGCFQGLQVEGSAQDVGRHTTRAVVQAIFLVIAAEAGFSVIFLVMEV